jgi:hypothetical protein
MRVFGRLVAVAAMLLLISVPVVAQEPYQQEREPSPGLALTAAFANVVFFPVRLGVTVFGGVLGGFTGFMTAGNEEAADDVWGLFEGQNILTPEILSGKESLRL